MTIADKRRPFFRKHYNLEMKLKKIEQIQSEDFFFRDDLFWVSKQNLVPDMLTSAKKMSSFLTHSAMNKH